MLKFRKQVLFVGLVLAFLVPFQAFAWWWLVPSAIRFAIGAASPASATLRAISLSALAYDASNVLFSPGYDQGTRRMNTKYKIKLSKVFLNTATAVGVGLTIAELMGLLKPDPSMSNQVETCTYKYWTFSSSNEATAQAQYAAWSGFPLVRRGATYFTQTVAGQSQNFEFYIEAQNAQGVWGNIQGSGIGSVVCTITTQTPLDEFDVVFEQLQAAPDQASKDAIVKDVAGKFQKMVKDNPSIVLPDDIIVAEDPFNFTGLQFDLNTQAVKKYSSDANGNMTVDGVPVITLNDFAQYTDAAGVVHTLKLDSQGNIFDNGVLVDPLNQSVAPSVSVKTNADGSTSTTTTTTGANGTSTTSTVNRNASGTVTGTTTGASNGNGNGTDTTASDFSKFGGDVGTALNSKFSPFTSGGAEECYKSKYVGTHCFSEFDGGGYWSGFVRTFFGILGGLIALFMPIYTFFRW